MRITDVETMVLRLPGVADVCDGSQDAFVVRIHTEKDNPIKVNVTPDTNIISWAMINSPKVTPPSKKAIACRGMAANISKST